MEKKLKDIKLIFAQALTKESDKEVSDYLDEICGQDLALRKDVDSLLVAHRKEGKFLDVLITEPDITLDDSPISESPGTTIGNYKLLKKIGEGGMAVVYSAQQEKPIKRKVAIKIIKLGMDTKQVIGRFDIERQALALMDHQNIAKIHDAGATETGRPYFVMELVEGQSITEYCDKNNLTTKERLNLFISVCNAVQHAHQKGIIHRDIKPTNVLVTVQDGKPVPKVIDFGIAKATGQQLTEKTVFTKFAQMIGTPEYMSPEQAETGGTDIDTRTDIYSLGVLLYELLTGVKPFDAEMLREVGYGEIQRIIREEDPTKPSTRLSTLGDTLTDVAQHRRTEPNVLRRLLQGDLDWIVMKSLEKDRDRRYETAAEFGTDIRRHLTNEPVVAVAPTAFYKMNKFIRRNRALVTGIWAVLIVLIGGIVVSSMFAIGQAHARKEAQQQVRITKAVNNFLNSHVIGQFSPYRAKGTELTIRSVLDSSVKALEGRFEDEPLIEASIRNALGNAYRSNGYIKQAEIQLKDAYQIYKDNSIENDMSTIQPTLQLGLLYIDCGRYNEAEPLMVEAVEFLRSVYGTDNASTLFYIHHLSRVYFCQGRYDEAELLELELLDTSRDVLDAEHPVIILATGGVGVAKMVQGYYAEAESILVKTVEMSSRIKGEDHAWTGEHSGVLGWLYLIQGRYDEAEPLLLKCHDMYGRLVGEECPWTVWILSYIGLLYTEQGRYAEAEDVLTKALENGRKGFGEEQHPEMLRAVNGLGILYTRQKHYGKAEKALIKALEGRRIRLGDEHPDTLQTMNDLALLYMEMNKFGEAEELLRNTIDGRQQKLRTGHPDTVKAMKSFAELYGRWGKPEMADNWRIKISDIENLKE